RYAAAGDVEFEGCKGDGLASHDEADGAKQARRDVVLAQCKFAEAEPKTILLGRNRATGGHIRAVNEGRRGIKCRLRAVGRRRCLEACHVDAGSLEAFSSQ